MARSSFNDEATSSYSDREGWEGGGRGGGGAGGKHVTERRRGTKRGRKEERQRVPACDHRNITGNFLEEFDRFLYRPEYFSPSFIFRNVSRSCYDHISLSLSPPLSYLLFRRTHERYIGCSRFSRQSGNLVLRSRRTRARNVEIRLSLYRVIILGYASHFSDMQYSYHIAMH